MLYLLVVGVVLLLIVAVIVLLVVCCKPKKRRGRYNPCHPVQESASAETTFTEEEQHVPESRNVDVDGVNESPLESVSHHTTIAYEVFML